ncbi:HNH endonuclease signature motif containing protein [Rosenbergiella australiborealis]|uniref:HNH endonuclease signature motif containing protein n=1 Tax=Rosenbergiella australiborealis TaxID=1544696 RepID=UPI001F4DF62D|nr:HNH endonuclease signature motif containing protein [Rosenbergiella australiborealis]
MIVYGENELLPESNLQLAKLREKLFYNSETGNFTARLERGVRIKSSIRDNGYITVHFSGKKYLAHRLAWFYMHGKWPEHDIDHINGNPSDNSLKNLREATRADNSHNRVIGKNNTSGLRCVSQNRRNGRWRINIWRGGHKFYLGEYISKVKAAQVANEWLRKNDGEFFSDVRRRSDLPEDQIALLANITKSKDLGHKPRLDSCQRVFVSHMLNAWGKWAYDGLPDKNQISPIARFMESVSGRGAITSDGLVAIMESLHNRGYHGNELIKKMAQIIANLKHARVETCSDLEGMFMDRMIQRVLGAKSILGQVAINYYVYGHPVETIAQYLQRITKQGLTISQARNRVRWCISLIEAKIYHEVIKETEIQEGEIFSDN